MTTNTFLAWLQAQTDRDDPIGDLAKDVLSDPCLPVADCGFTALRSHVKWTHHASAAALDALDRAYAEWMA